MKIYLGADHRGFELKEKVAKWLFDWGYEFFDVGAYHPDPKDDYPIYAQEVASLVANNKGSKGILLCGSGVGVSIAANKLDGVRASIGFEVDQVMAGRHDDDMNVLVIAADFSDEKKAESMIKVFLETKFGAKERYKRRLEIIRRMEENN